MSPLGGGPEGVDDVEVEALRTCGLLLSATHVVDAFLAVRAHHIIKRSSPNPPGLRLVCLSWSQSKWVMMGMGRMMGSVKLEALVAAVRADRQRALFG